MGIQAHVLRIAVATQVFLAAGCGAVGVEKVHCASIPCPMPLAMTINVTSATTGSAIANASMTVAGPTTTAGPCGSAGQCFVLGYAGAYSVTISAPAYQPVQRTVTVPGTTPACGCQTTTPQQVAVALVPSP